MAKRTAEHQITKDDESPEKAEEQEPGSFPKASAEVLKQRKIVKAKRPDNASNDTTKPSVFGAAFAKGGFADAATKIGFGFGTSKPTSSTASLFGSSTGGFASTTSSESGFGKSESSASAFGKSESPQAAFGTSELILSQPKPSVVLPEQVELVNGEEKEDCLIELRIKSFMLVHVKDEKPLEEPTSAAAPSVPPSSTGVLLVKKDDEKDSTTESKEKDASEKEVADEKDATTDESKRGAQPESEDKDVEESSKKEDKKEPDDKPEKQDDKKESEDAPKQKWREVGIGPLRVLKMTRGHSRVVQRRETTPGGAGTKLIMNVALPKESTVQKPGEKHVRLTTFESSGKVPVVYLLKAKPEDAQQLYAVLEKVIAEADSCVSHT